MLNKISTLTEQLAQLAISHQLKLVTAESCTGGYISKTLTDLAGSSSWFECGFVTYSNASKETLLGVENSLLARYGAVSEEVIKAMCKGALERTAAHLAISVSGIAGPDGGTKDKPVGTVWLGWQLDGLEHTAQFIFKGSRADIREQAVVEALKGAISMIQQKD
jgi:nicotinamide-nucleotide amidase